MKSIKKSIVGLTLLATLMMSITGVAAVVDKTANYTKSYGVGTNFYICYWQHTEYLHKKYYHGVRSMMNDKYSSYVHNDAGKWAKVDSPESWGGWSTNRSYFY